jgi:hypothetical protein
MDDAARNFNAKLSQLINKASTLVGEDAVYTLRRRVNTVRSEDRELLVAEGGPILYRFREPISQGDWEYFIGLDASLVTESAEAIQIIDMLRDSFIKADPTDKQLVIELAQGLLSDFCIYYKAGGAGRVGALA